MAEIDPTSLKSSTSGSFAGRRPVALRFISGKYQGGEVALTPQKEIVVGRSSELEMVLVEEMVSRKHARIFWEGDQIHIEDLGSTNGTFVNGEKIKRATLKEGDRVLIGTSILKVVAVDASGPHERSPQEIEVEAQRRPGPRTMSGAIDEIPLPDLLQLLSSSKKSGVLVIRAESHDVGKLYLRKGQLYYATINDNEELAPLKAVFRLLTWEKGSFDLEPPDETAFPNEIDASVPELLMEGLRQLDELNSIAPQLPPRSAHLTLSLPLGGALKDLSHEELDVLQLAHNLGNMQAVFDRSPALDLDTAQALARLLKQKYVTAT